MQKQYSNFSDTQDSKMAPKIAPLTQSSFVRNPTHAERNGVLNLRYGCVCCFKWIGRLLAQ